MRGKGRESDRGRGQHLTGGQGVTTGRWGLVVSCQHVGVVLLTTEAFNRSGEGRRGSGDNGFIITLTQLDLYR